MLPDYLSPHLDVVFVGTSAGTLSAALRHYYSRPNNAFWDLLWEADLTGDRRLLPEQDAQVLDFRIGLTDLVQRRASSSDNLLRAGDYDVPAFVKKIKEFQPFVVATNGKKAAEKISRYLGRGLEGYGLADWSIGESIVYVLPSSSAANSNPSHFFPKRNKNEWWVEFGQWLRRSRRSPTSTEDR